MSASFSLATPGAKGMLALPLTAAVGHAFAFWYVGRLGGLHPLGKVAINAIVLCIMAGFFWCWAAFKLLALGDPDMGVVTFMLAFLAAYRTADLCAVHIARKTSRSHGSAKSLRQMQTLLPAACFAPMINYILVLSLIPTLPFTFQCYLVMGSFTWCVCAIRGGWLLGEDHVVSALRNEERAMRDKRAAEEHAALCRATGSDDG